MFLSENIKTVFLKRLLDIPMVSSGPVKNRIEEPFLPNHQQSHSHEYPNDQIPSKDWHSYSHKADKAKSNTLKQCQR